MNLLGYKFALALLIVSAATDSVWPVGARPQESERDTIKSRVRQAKERGEREVILYAPIDLPEVTGNLDEALSSFNVVVARPIEHLSYVRGSDVVTWHKFKILEDFSPKNLPACRICSPERKAPDEMLPLKEGEFVAAIWGGTLLLDGVKVVGRYGELHPFLSSQRYLLFFRLDPSSRVGILSPGAAGAFAVRPDGGIEPMGKKEDTLAREIEGRYGNSLDKLRAGINR